jgi:hypothetical protein
MIDILYFIGLFWLAFSMALAFLGKDIIPTLLGPIWVVYAMIQSFIDDLNQMKK